MPTRKIKLGDFTVRLDAHADRLDLRDRPYQPPLAALPPCWPQPATLRRLLPKLSAQGLVLDQGRQGACTGYGLAAAVNFMLALRAAATGQQAQASVSPHMLYDLARFYDEWPGEQYQGSSCRGAMKGWSKHGCCALPLWRRSVHSPGTRAYHPDPDWADDAQQRPLGVYYRVERDALADLQAAIRDIGAVYVSAAVHDGWALGSSAPAALEDGHDGLPLIAWHAGAEVSGQHAFALVGYNARGFVVQNSWGPRWGLHGFAVLGYADWLQHASDAWVAGLGVPQVAALTLPARARRIASAPLPTATATATTARTAASATTATTAKTATTATTTAAPPAFGARPARWSTDQAYAHALVAGNNGVVRISRPDIGRPALMVQQLVRANLGRWLASPAGASGKLLIYAHGGLNSEADSIERVRVLGPCFAANGIYPLFYCWRTGVLETIGAAFDDALGPPAQSLLGTRLDEATDTFLEALAHKLRWSWAEMKNNAAQAAQDGGALALLAAELAALRRDHGALEVHLLGHSAGAFVHGHLLDLCQAAALPVASVTLYAPACPLAYATRHYRARVDDGFLAPQRFWLHLLSDARERADRVGPYRKSLLYLVDRGFEERRKTPLLGLARVQQREARAADDALWSPADWAEVRAWRAWLAALPAQADGRPACELLEAPVAVSPWRSVAPTHAGFDHDVALLGRSINRILGRPAGTPLAAPVDDLDF